MEWAFGARQASGDLRHRVDKDWYVEHYAILLRAAFLGRDARPGRDSTHHAAAGRGMLYKIRIPTWESPDASNATPPARLRLIRRGEVHISEQGVRCEACHGAGAGHALILEKNIRNPAALSAAQLNEFCGKCHRPPAAKGVTIDWNYPWNVRHQPVYLSESACFRKSRGGLSCLPATIPTRPQARTTPRITTAAARVATRP